jgi:hypothetical protein
VLAAGNVVVIGLVESGAEDDVEQRPLLCSEGHVGARDGGEPVGRRSGVGRECGGEAALLLGVAANRERSQQGIAVGEVLVRSGAADSGPARRLRHREASRSSLGDQLEGGGEQRVAQVAVVLAGTTLDMSRHGQAG